MPAEAPATACCHNGRGGGSSGEVMDSEIERGDERAFHCRNNKVTVSLLPNQAAHPPVSRIKVPNCPFQNPRIPWCLHTSRITLNGLGATLAAPSALPCTGT